MDRATFYWRACCHGNKVSGHVFVLGVSILPLSSIFFDWNVEMFRQCGKYQARTELWDYLHAYICFKYWKKRWTFINKTRQYPSSQKPTSTPPPPLWWAGDNGLNVWLTEEFLLSLKWVIKFSLKWATSCRSFVLSIRSMSFAGLHRTK